MNAKSNDHISSSYAKNYETEQNTEKENSTFTTSEMLYTVFLATILIPPASYRYVPTIVVYYMSYSKV